ncbi:MAG: hypothetical protein KKC19_02020 [Nanoarchaeota archaeon]|nr:hypothetical protein [Nanoarchaeota archaeon]
MRYFVRYDLKAEKQLEKLPKEISQRIIRKIRNVAETGRGIESLKDEAYGFKIRVGNYRILIDLCSNPNEIIVRYIGLRGKVYKRI